MTEPRHNAIDTNQGCGYWEAIGEGEINPMAEDTCPVCHGALTIVTSGPDYFGNCDTDDCPCQTNPDFDPVDYEEERDYP